MKLTPEQRDHFKQGLRKLRGSSEFKVLQELLLLRLEGLKTSLVVAPPNLVQTLQGRAQEVDSLMSDLQELTQ